MGKRGYVRVGSGFGRRLAVLRKAKGLSQVEFGKLVGATQRMISNYERRNGRPRADLIGRMAKVFGVEVEELVMSKAERKRAESEENLLWRKLRRSEELADDDRRTARRMIKDLLTRL